MVNEGVPIPLHLAVHVLGVAVAAGLAALGRARREDAGPTWLGLVLGAVLVALSHVVEGGLFVASGSLPLVLRAAGYAGIGIGIAGPLRSGGAVAGVALVAPVPVHVLVGIAGLAAAATSVRSRLVVAGSTALLGAGLGAWGLADLVSVWVPTVGGTLSLIGSLAVGAWVVVVAGSSLLARVLAGATALVVVTVIVLSSAGGIVFATDLEQDQLEDLQALASAQAAVLGADDPSDLQALATQLAGNDLHALLGAAVVPSLDGLAQSMAEAPGVDIALIIGPDNRIAGSWDVIAALPGPLSPVDETVLLGSGQVGDAFAGSPTGGTLSDGSGRLLAVGAVPVAPIDANGTKRLDRLNGVLVLGRSLTSVSAVGRLAEQTAADAVIVSSGIIVASSDPNLRTTTVDNTSVDAQIDALLTSRELPARAVIGEQTRYVAAAQIGPGSQLVLLRGDAIGVNLESEATRTLFVAGLIGLALATALGAAAARRAVAPVLALTSAAEAIADGDGDVTLPGASEDEVGRLAGAFSTMMTAVAERERDLAEAADIEADLRRRLEIITGSLSEGLVAVDEHGVINRANPAARKLLGVEDPIGRPVTKVLVGRDETGRSIITALAASSGRVVKATVGPGQVEVAATSAPLLDARGRSLGRVHLLRDITGEAQAERMKTEFLANISHELRTPLTPVRGYADVLRRRELPHEQVADISGRIADAAQRLERVIGMLVDYAALEAGRLDVSLAPTSVATTVEDALSELTEEVVTSRVKVDVDPELPPVDVDPMLFRRQLVELLDNALKFSDDEVTVSARRGPSRTMEIRVGDHGPGIEESMVDQLTEGFRQGDGSATRRHGGLGLGLALVGRIADALGGEVRFETPPGGGTDAVLVVQAVLS